MKQSKTIINTEEQDQRLLIEYMDLQKGIKYTHVPNSTFTKSWAVKLRNKALGVRPGFPDLIIIIKHTLFCIELKREKGGILSSFQKEWIQALQDAHIPVHICKGFQEGKDVIDSYYTA